MTQIRLSNETVYVCVNWHYKHLPTEHVRRIDAGQF